MWSLSDALLLQTLLDRAGIPVFMGPEPATAVEAVTSNFASGVSVRVMRVGLPWARQAMLNYTSANEATQQQEEEWHKLLILCPKSSHRSHLRASTAQATKRDGRLYF